MTGPFASNRAKEGFPLKKELLSCVLALCLTACAPAGSSAASLSPAAVPEYPKALSFDDYEGRRAVREEYPVSRELTGQPVRILCPLFLAGIGRHAEQRPVLPGQPVVLPGSVRGKCPRGDPRRPAGRAGPARKRSGGAKALYNNLYQDNEMGALKPSISFWINEDFSVNQDFLDQAAEDFYAHSYLCDFSDAAAGEAMGDWLKEATGGLLGGQAVETAPETLMTLFSALYYSDQWIDEFQKDRNTEGTSITPTLSQPGGVYEPHLQQPRLAIRRGLAVHRPESEKRQRHVLCPA